VGEVARHVRTQVLALAALGGLTAALLPTMALSEDGANREVRIFHQTVGLTQTDLRDPDAVGAAINQFADSVYGPRDVHAASPIPLAQFTGSVGAQARRETWASLVLDVWMGGDGSPAGYYVRYRGRTASGGLVDGESFLASPDTPEKLRLARHSGLVGRITGVDNDVAGTLVLASADR
jgi:hypothetical protein